MPTWNWYGLGAAVGAAGSIVSAFLSTGGLRAGFAIVGAALAAFFLHQIIAIYREARAAEAAARAAEQAALLAELAASRCQADKWITNHLSHDKDEREKHAQVLGEIAKQLSATAELLRCVKDQTLGGFKTSQEEHAQLRLDIANNKTGRRRK